MAFAFESKEATLGELLGVAEAAERLGVSATHVRQLIRRGALPARRISAGWIIHEIDLGPHRGPRRRGRPLSPRMAWGLLVLCEGDDAGWLDHVERSRIRARLRAHPQLSEVAALCRGRADVRYLYGHRSVLRRFLKHPGVVATGASAHGHDVIDLGVVEAYVRPRDLRAVTRELSLIARDTLTGANVVARVPADGLWPFDHLQAGRATVAVDLWDSGDVRSRRAAARLWDRVLADAKWEPSRVKR